jgi:hypothetical protein
MTTTKINRTRSPNKPKSGLKPIDNLICYLGAWGLKGQEIAEEARVSDQKVSDVLNSELGIARVKEIQKEVWGTDAKKWMERILPEAIQTAYEIMTHPEAKLSVRLQAAESFIDRTMGKAPQTLVVEDTTMRNIIEKLDRIEQLKKTGQIQASDIVDAEFKSVQDNDKKETKDQVDQWMSEEYETEKNLPTATTSLA